MKTTDPFSPGALTAAELYRQSRSPLETAMRGAFGPADDLRRLMDQIDGPMRAIRQMRSDPFRDTLDTVLRFAREQDGLRHTMRAVEEARRQREQFVRTLAGTDLLRTRELTATAFDSGVLRTADAIRRNTDGIAAIIAATRPAAELSGLASSVMRGIDALRVAGERAGGAPTSAEREFAEQYTQAQQLAEELGEAETEEQRAALLARLIAIVASTLRGLSDNTRQAVLGLSVLAIIGLAADIKSLLPSDPPPGMPAAQVRMLEETRHDVDALLRDFQGYRDSERRLDEAYVSDLPRAELGRPATIRTEPSRSGKALFKAPAGTLLAIAGSQGRWKRVVFRDPLTDELAQAWVYGTSVSPLDGR